MAHDGFLGGSFHALVWPLPFDAAALQAQLMGAAGVGGGWEDESALSSLVSSPAAATGGVVHEAVLMDEMASRLGGVCGGLGGVPSPPSSRYASCYSTPVSSPASKPGPHVTSQLAAADTTISERAARLSCLAGVGPGCGKLSRVASSQSLLAEPATAAAVVTGAVHQLPTSDGSSSDGPCRKRKTPGAKAKGKDGATATTIAKSPEPGTKAKKCKLSADAAGDEDTKPVAGEAGRGGNGKEKDAAAGEMPKDYIHVRARRGQATDSHSLAERVRREKISERMKLLQDLVPGCNKVTGKAVMLDEIINYVQSLQRQVEFLSMKLSTVNPQLDFDVNNFLPKDASEPNMLTPLSRPPQQPPLSYSPECASPAICYASSQGTAMQSVVTTTKGFEMAPAFANHGMPVPSLDRFHSANSQAGSCMWEDDLQSVVQMGFRGNTT
ncbi:hypothetical protein E2562_024017 [Oryza meyeriana var. granulata]|uniref:BHLH domain-containing protein n=1 Tax=Oryza meyeriana var. granulata TaxID=110450 RepID=A0A6G1EBU8_9ORYZ|nr:hypothetical protein E2562_024017 [Oryza meyeriana var. granulata]